MLHDPHGVLRMLVDDFNKHFEKDRQQYLRYLEATKDDPTLKCKDFENETNKDT